MNAGHVSLCGGGGGHIGQTEGQGECVSACVSITLHFIYEAYETYESVYPLQLMSCSV